MSLMGSDLPRRQSGTVALEDLDANDQLAAILEAGHPNHPCPDCAPYWINDTAEDSE